MDLFLRRQAGLPPPDAATLEAAVRRQPWLTHRPDDPLRTGGTFAFPGGGLYVVSAPLTDGPYSAPWIYVWLGRDDDFGGAAPGLVGLAGELGLGVDLACPSGRWWEAPRPSTLGQGFLERAVKASAVCRGAEAWLLLGFVLADAACLELAESNPALAAFVASKNWLERGAATPTAERQALLRDLARLPRPEILARAGGWPTRSAVKMLGRVVPERLSVEALRLLAEGDLTVNADEALRHLPRFRCGTIHLVGDRRLWPHVGPGLLREAAEAEDEHAIPILLRDTIALAERLGAPGRVRVVPSRARLVELHDRLVAEWNARRQAAPPVPEERPNGRGRGRQARACPPALPPPATPAIVPLCTAEALWREGVAMGHCVGSYDRRVLRGECLVYRVTEPERATLSIQWSAPRGPWTIEQLLGPKNRPVAPATRAAVQRWLDQEDALPPPLSGGSRASRHFQQERGFAA